MFYIVAPTSNGVRSASSLLLTPRVFLRRGDCFKANVFADVIRFLSQ